MLIFSEMFEFSRENSYFERIRMVRMVRLVRMVRMVRSLADRTFQLWRGRLLLPGRLADRTVQLRRARRVAGVRARRTSTRRARVRSQRARHVEVVARTTLVERYDIEPFADFSAK